MNRPNVLLILTDQHRPDHLGFGGNPIVQTPTLDALATRSMRFTNAFVTNPLCQPNRCSMLTMRYPSVHGTRHNGIALDWDSNTFVRRLRSEGYRTGLVGKGHFQNFELFPNIARQQFDFSLAEQARITGLPGTDGWDRYESIDRHLTEDIVFPDDYYGFDHVEILSNHGDVVTGHWVKWLREKGLDWADVAGPDNAEWALPEWGEVRKPSMPPELYPTTFVAERSIDWIESRAPDEHQLRHAMAYEYGAITMIDDSVASVLDALDRSGQADETIVIFTSDHGDMFGDHGLLLKMFVHYDGVLRVPFTISGPGVEPGTTDSLCNTLDLGETILDLCDVESYYGSQGLSLRPILDDPTVELRHELLIEEDQIRDGLNAGVQPRLRSVVTRDARLTRYQNLDRHDLYDLANDPDELENRWDDSSSRGQRAEMGERLTELMIATANPSYRPDYIA